ncbi:hypothetical protein C2845_PM07G21910 [Panicum miliaceum]|uniref:Uncharacterized protein n=1 Tax=Panicum miliaceum TaxID=4540 RepID=A0A3L6SNU6_PANMI|nr:hypothetical protein C2845_PM07G21910 [Panicum miliaceum]
MERERRDARAGERRGREKSPSTTPRRRALPTADRVAEMTPHPTEPKAGPEKAALAREAALPLAADAPAPVKKKQHLPDSSTIKSCTMDP